MQITVARLGIAALLCAGRASAQHGFGMAAASCVSNAAMADGCMSHGKYDPSANDLTPTQWLFGGRDAYAKLVQTPTMASVAGATHIEWRSLAGAYAPTVMTTKRRGAAPVAAAHVDTASAPADPAGTQRFLIQEWRQAELSAADSVYHETLLQLAATFDSAQRAHVVEPQWTAILRRLDGLLTADADTWERFRAHIEQRADSALAIASASLRGSQ